MKAYELERRVSFDKEYLKVFLADQSLLLEVQNGLNKLASVRKANITEHEDHGSTKKDLTLYPQKPYSFEDMCSEVDKVLKQRF